MSTTTPQYRLVIFDTIDEPHGAARPVCRVTGMHPTDAVQWLARARGPGPAAGGGRGSQAAGWPVEAGDRGRGLADRPVSGAEPAADGPSRRVPRRRVPDRGPAGRADALGALGPDRADLRRPDRGRGRVPQCLRPAMALDGRLRNPRPGPDEAAAGQPPRPGDPDSPRSGRRGDRSSAREPRIAFRVVENQMNYAYLGRPPEPVGRRQFPVFRRRPLRPGRRGLHHPLDPLAPGAPRSRRVRIPQLAGPARLREPPAALELVPPRSRRPGRLRPARDAAPSHEAATAATRMTTTTAAPASSITAADESDAMARAVSRRCSGDLSIPILAWSC